MILTKFFAIATLAVASVAAVSPTATEGTLSVDHPLDLRVVQSIRDSAIPQVIARQLTNAQRLRMGLKLKPPVRRSKVARDAVPSQVPETSKTGYVLMKDTNTGATLGYIANTNTLLGRYGVVTADVNAALQVKFTPSSTGPFSITTLNGPDANFPFIGGFEGLANTPPKLSPGSYNYLLIGPTKETPAGSSPVVMPGGTQYPQSSTGLESAIWNFSDGVLSAQWRNADGSVPATYVGWKQGQDILIATGDKARFTAVFGEYHWVTFQFVEIP